MKASPQKLNYMKGYYRDHLKEKREYNRQYYKDHHEEIINGNRDWRRKNPKMHKEQLRRHDEKHPGYEALKGRKWRMEKKFGISIEIYDQMSKEQGGKCYICGGHNENGRRLCVDHNHKTGLVRRLLCGRCNRVLGNTEDSQTLLKKMIAYLKQHEDAIAHRMMFKIREV